MSRTTINVRVQQNDKYKLRNFLFDCFMVAITGGLWLIWIFVREMRKK